MTVTWYAPSTALADAVARAGPRPHSGTEAVAAGTVVDVAVVVVEPFNSVVVVVLARKAEASGGVDVEVVVASVVEVVVASVVEVNGACVVGDDARESPPRPEPARTTA
ncbi:MAG: hypothetical protein ACRDV9_14755 [Acidimicrobiia bacterium]